MKVSKEAIGAWSTDNLYYLSATWISKEKFGQCRLQRDICRAWMERKLDYGGQTFQDIPPDLSQAEIASIPGGEASMQNMDSLRWEVLERNGTKLCIKADEHRFWSSQSGDVSETYAALKKQHDVQAEQFTGFADAAQAEPQVGGGQPDAGAGEDPGFCDLFKHKAHVMSVAAGDCLLGGNHRLVQARLHLLPLSPLTSSRRTRALRIRSRQRYLACSWC